MAGGIDWFRWHHGSVTDPKFALVARRTGASLSDVLAVWAYMLEHASASEDRGAFEPIDFEAWDCLFGFPDGRTKAIHDAMQDRDLVGGGRVTSWGKRQPKREDETANDRKRRQREREHESAVAAALASASVTDEASRDVTHGHADVTHGHARGEERREEERREEREPAKPKVFAQPETGRATKKCPKAFALTPELLAWAAENHPELNPHAELEAMRDHTFANARTDWAGTWRNWMRRARGTGPPTAQQRIPAFAKGAAIEAHNQAVLDRILRDEGLEP